MTDAESSQRTYRTQTVARSGLAMAAGSGLLGAFIGAPLWFMTATFIAAMLFLLLDELWADGGYDD